MTKTKVGYWGFIFITITIFTIYAVSNISGYDGQVALARTIEDDPRLVPSTAFLVIGSLDSGESTIASALAIDEESVFERFRRRFSSSDQSSVVCAISAHQRDTLVALFAVATDEFTINGKNVDVISVDGGGLSHVELSQALRDILGVPLDCNTFEVGSIQFFLFNAHLS